MTDFTSPQITPQADAETEAAIEQIFTEIRYLNELIRQEQAAIDRLKAESNVITGHTDSVLSRLRIQMDALERIA